MDKRLRERRALQHDLRSAIARDEFASYYQPQAQIDGEIIGFEALVRWHNPSRGFVSAGHLHPARRRERPHLPIGEWILREACREAASWPNPLQHRRQFVADAISAWRPARPGSFDPSGDRSGREPAGARITEGVLIGDFSRAVSILRRLKTLGVRIAMDDFGTGYSSLSYLQAFPFDKIKIDHSFVSNLEPTRNRRRSSAR